MLYMAEPLVSVKCEYVYHLLITQFKVKGLKIHSDALGAHNHIPLDVEPDQNLACALVLLSSVSFLGFSSKEGSSGLT